MTKRLKNPRITTFINSALLQEMSDALQGENMSQFVRNAIADRIAKLKNVKNPAA